MYDTNWEVEFEDLERRYKELEETCDIKDKEIRRLHDVCRELQEELNSTSTTKINNKDNTTGYAKSEKLDNNFTVKISCDGDLDEDGLTKLLRYMLDNMVNCTEYVIDVYKD